MYTISVSSAASRTIGLIFGCYQTEFCSKSIFQQYLCSCFSSLYYAFYNILNECYALSVVKHYKYDYQCSGSLMWTTIQYGLGEDH